MIYLNVPGMAPDLVERKYFTLDECLENANLANTQLYGDSWHDLMESDISQGAGLAYFINYARLCVPPLFRVGIAGSSWPVPIGLTAPTKNNEIFREFFFGRLWPTYAAAYIGSIESRNNQTESEQAVAVYTEFYKNELAPLLINTWRKYAYLVQLYEEKIDTLADRVKSASATRTNFNDTPQESTTDVWDDPTHETTLTKSLQETESDLNTPMERLNEIRNKIEDIYAAWVYEFDKIFIREPMQ